MTENQKIYSLETPTQEPSNYVLKIHELMDDIPEGVVSERAVELSASLLEMVHETYDDPAGPRYKPYHNSQHSLNVLRRSWRLWGLFQEQLPDKFDDDGYETLLFGAAGHELFVDGDTAAGKDEKRSGKFTLRYLLSAGYDHDKAKRVFCAIEATTVEREEDGSIIQSNVRRGSKDPAKLILAMADINGIPMEGIPTMLEDALNLDMEYSQTCLKDLLQHPKKALGFVLAQADFLEDRLAAMEGDIAYYFEGEEKKIVEEVFQKEFSGTSREALALASRMKRAPSLAEVAIEKALSSGKSASSIAALPKKFGHFMMRSGEED